MQLVLLEAQ
jgi:hypothetical protein